MTALRSRTCLSSLMTPLRPYPQTARMTPGPFTKPPMSEATDKAVRVLIPPGRDAQLSSHPSVAQQERSRNIRSIRELGRRKWHMSSGYSKRSLVENTMYRYKTIIGRSMRSRSFGGQQAEVRLASRILNTMTHPGHPLRVETRQARGTCLRLDGPRSGVASPTPVNSS